MGGSPLGGRSERPLVSRWARVSAEFRRTRHAVPVTLEGDWQRLIEALDGWTSAKAVAPGRIEVTRPGRTGRGRAVIVMTPEEWGDMTGTLGGSFDDAVGDVKRSLRRLRPHEGFAVYSQYRLEGSATPSLPPVTDVPPPGGGR